ncbi:hypothetical protein D9613_008828 [Agrocybe pediades]|uniref:Uncharacterized protein n=1 Tax=Agrocybe pediades TaxID=84607 RepID=A0A8H4VMP8_9AGAR|nr:hypothetical protein D9613_008828 [Agrocybe pediades]
MPLLEDLTLGSTIFERVPGMPASPIGLDWFLRQLETIPVGRKLQSIFLRPAIYDPSLCIVESSSHSEELKHFEQTILQEVLPKTEEFRIGFFIRQKGGHSEGPQLAKEKILRNLPVLQALNLLHFEEYGK